MPVEGRGYRQVIEQDITTKISSGEDIAHLHLPARDMTALFLLAKGGRVKNLDERSPVGLNAESLTHSLRYLRDALGAKDTEQAFAMLVARGLPFPDALLPPYRHAAFTEENLMAIRMWVEGKPGEQIREQFTEKGFRSHFYRMRQRLQAASDIQVVAVAIKEGFLLPKRHDDGTFRFEIDTNAQRMLTEDQKMFLKMRFSGIAKTALKTQKHFSDKEMTKIMHTLQVDTFPQAVFSALQSGQLDLDELVEKFDVTAAVYVLNHEKMRILLEKTIETGGSLTDQQLAHAIKATPKAVRSMKDRMRKGMEVHSFLQAAVVYLSAVQRGIIPGYDYRKRRDRKLLPSSGTIFHAHRQ